jgi:hypothetical protein
MGGGFLVCPRSSFGHSVGEVVVWQRTHGSASSDLRLAAALEEGAALPVVMAPDCTLHRTSATAAAVRLSCGRSSVAGRAVCAALLRWVQHHSFILDDWRRATSTTTMAQAQLPRPTPALFQMFTRSQLARNTRVAHQWMVVVLPLLATTFRLAEADDHSVWVLVFQHSTQRVRERLLAWAGELMGKHRHVQPAHALQETNCSLNEAD